MQYQNLTAPETYADVRKPLMQASTLPPYCYTAQEWYDLEVERMWRRSWILLGRAEEVPNPGDYRRVDIVGEPLIMVRGRDNLVRVFSAICRHRGCIIKRGDGNSNALSCPYHGWTYSLTGELVGVPGMKEVENFRKEDFGLIPVKTETWGGFILINLDPKAAPLMDSLGTMARRLESYRFEDMRVTRKLVNRVEGNWKIWLENSREGYHTRIVHAKTYQRFYHGRGTNEWRHVGEPGVYELMSGSNDDGLYLPLDPTLPMVEGLSEEDLNTTHFALFYPHLLLNIPPSHLAFHQLFPEGPNATTIVTWFCFPKTTVELPTFEQDVQRYYEIVEAFVPEDLEITVLTQRGLRGHLARPGRFAPDEFPCHGFANWLLDMVLDRPRR
jgi:choline monooxygenase